MTSKEIKNLSQDQLKEQIAQERERLLRLKFAHAISTIENPLRIQAVRKNIARLNTELTKRKAEANASAVEGSVSE